MNKIKETLKFISRVIISVVITAIIVAIISIISIFVLFKANLELAILIFMLLSAITYCLIYRKR